MTTIRCDTDFHVDICRHRGGVACVSSGVLTTSVSLGFVDDSIYAVQFYLQDPYMAALVAITSALLFKR